MESRSVLPAASAEPADWLVRDDVDWWDLVRYGPPGFDVYLRVRFEHHDGAADEPGELLNLRHALETLAAHTSTPDDAFAAIWEGWSSGREAPGAPRVPIPDREMLLFAGPVVAMRDAPARAWNVSGTSYQEPHLVWPEDRAWCVACEVDEEVEFSVGCSEAAALALTAALPGATRRVGYGDPAPLYRDDD